MKYEKTQLNSTQLNSTETRKHSITIAQSASDKIEASSPEVRSSSRAISPDSPRIFIHKNSGNDKTVIRHCEERSDAANHPYERNSIGAGLLRMRSQRRLGVNKLATQKGFTLVELAIVLVIIGLLVGVIGYFVPTKSISKENHVCFVYDSKIGRHLFYHQVQFTACQFLLKGA